MERSAAAIRSTSGSNRSRRPLATVLMASVGVGALLLGACGGDDDDSADTTVSPEITVAPTSTTVAQATTTSTSTTTLPPLELVTEGATIVVANASGIDGAAGRMTDQLDVVGFSTGDATNSSEDQLETSKVYYDPENEDAQPVAESLREALGGGDIEVLELAVPAPTESGEIGDATVLLAMGNDTADKSLDELQGRVPPSTDDPGDGDPGDGDQGTDEETTDEETTDEDSTDEETTDEETTEEETTEEDTSGG